MGSTIEFTRPDGKTAPGYLAEPPDGPNAPGVVMFEEWWGINAEIKADADRLARAGFRVLIPDLYRGEVADTREQAGHLSAGLDFGDAATQDAQGAAAYLRGHGAEKIGIIGFCMGGALTLIAAMHDPGSFSSAVVFYGYPPPEAGDPGTIKVPVMGHWAANDEFFNIAGVHELAKKLAAGGVKHTFHRYDAGHAFANPKGIGNYQHDAAETAWQRTVEFFKETLG